MKEKKVKREGDGKDEDINGKDRKKLRKEKDNI